MIGFTLYCESSGMRGHSRPVMTSRKWTDIALHHLTSPGSKCRVNHNCWPCPEAGLLTSPPSLRRLPGDDADHEFANQWRESRAMCCQGVTAAGTVQDSHLIPFSSLAPKEQETSTHSICHCKDTTKSLHDKNKTNILSQQ